MSLLFGRRRASSTSTKSIKNDSNKVCILNSFFYTFETLKNKNELYVSSVHSKKELIDRPDFYSVNLSDYQIGSYQPENNLKDLILLPYFKSFVLQICTLPDKKRCFLINFKQFFNKVLVLNTFLKYLK